MVEGKKIAFHTLGCKLNFSETSTLSRQFDQEGYEKKEFQFLESFLESFRIFILRNKEMNTASKKIHQDFIKIIHRLIKMEFASAREIELFKSKINNNNNLPDKAWILEKLEAI